MALNICFFWDRMKNVYVVELSKDVLNEKKFIKANPGYVTGMPCVYVGMTGLDPDVRFDNHKAGIRSSKYVTRFGLRLMTELFEHLNPMPYGDAQYMEVDLGIRLRAHSGRPTPAAQPSAVGAPRPAHTRSASAQTGCGYRPEWPRGVKLS